jgi:uncharacterized phage protein gp47/JayE
MYEEQTYEAILERMLDRVPDKFDKREGSVIWDTHSPTAIELQTLYIELDSLIQEAYGDTASREYLILRCRERGITPYPATNAILKGEFTPNNIDVTGCRFNMNDLNFVVLDKISNGIYRVQCETAGTTGNQYLGTLIPINYVEGLETAQLTEVLIPGQDEEETEDLRERYFDSFDEFSFGGNRADYYEKVKAIDGVGEVKVQRVWNNDVAPADLIPNNAVDNWYNNNIDNIEDTDVKTWLRNIYMCTHERKFTVGGTVLIIIIDSDDYGEASSTLIQSVQETLDPVENAGEGYGVAPIGHIVTVRSADPLSIQVSTQIAFNNGYTWNSTKEAIEAVISEYFLDLRKDWGKNDYTVIRISQIEAKILSVDGVVDVQNTKLNGISSNITLGKYQIPIFGGITNG